MQTQTTTIEVVLSTSTYALIAERAKAEGVEPAHYWSILLTDYFVNDSKNISLTSAAKKMSRR